MGAVSGKGTNSHLLYVYDNNSKKKFLVDSGANISVFPVGNSYENCEEDSSLVAANGTKIKTFGEKLLKLNIGMRREFKWPFVIALVQYPILGADFLSFFKLSISMYDRSITDNVTGIKHIVDYCVTPQMTVFSAVNGYHSELLSKYPSLTSETVIACYKA